MTAAISKSQKIELCNKSHNDDISFWLCIDSVVPTTSCCDEASTLSKRSAIVNLEAGYPTAAETRRRVATELELARRNGIAVLKLIHGYGSSGKGGKLRSAVRAALTASRAEGRVGRVVLGEAWSIFDEDSRALIDRYPDLRRDSDLEKANAGITLVEVKPSAQASAVDRHP